jgi:glycogen debranching enzyme
MAPLLLPQLPYVKYKGRCTELKKAAARIATQLGLPGLARKLDREAEALREQFEREFWDEDLGTYALALD